MYLFIYRSQFLLYYVSNTIATTIVYLTAILGEIFKLTSLNVFSGLVLNVTYLILYFQPFTILIYLFFVFCLGFFGFF
jgi:hypothetical protein